MVGLPVGPEVGVIVAVLLGGCVGPTVGEDDGSPVGTVFGATVRSVVGNEEEVATVVVVGSDVRIVASIPEGLCVPLGVDGDTTPVFSEGDCVGSEMVGVSVNAAFGTMFTGAFDGGIGVVILGAFVVTTIGVSVVGIAVGDNVDGL
eukprot:scaffold7349_cov173-Amphora_coffeaeformis.AAC.121